MIVAGGIAGSTVVGPPGAADGMPCDAKTKQYYEAPETLDPQVTEIFTLCNAIGPQSFFSVLLHD